MRDHWTLDTINWKAFDRTKVDPDLVPMMRAASLVEANAKDYVEYLRKVFKGDPETMAVLERWGTEEVQHGAALGRWAKRADAAETRWRRWVDEGPPDPPVVDAQIRPRLRGGQELQTEIGGYTKTREKAVIFAVSPEATGPNDAAKYIGPQLADALNLLVGLPLVVGRNDVHDDRSCPKRRAFAIFP